VSTWGKEVDIRLAAALRRGDRIAAGCSFAEYLLPGRALRPVRRLLAPLTARAVMDRGPRDDMLVEIEAELTYDSRDALGRIRAPALLICGDRDRFFPPAVVRETAARIPDCQLVWYSRAGHIRAASSGRIARDVLAFAP
jgi:pimeloyl-ACP methyl ester carboxylesterase